MVHLSLPLFWSWCLFPPRSLTWCRNPCCPSRSWSSKTSHPSEWCSQCYVLIRPARFCPWLDRQCSIRLNNISSFCSCLDRVGYVLSELWPSKWYWIGYISVVVILIISDRFCFWSICIEFILSVSWQSWSYRISSTLGLLVKFTPWSYQQYFFRLNQERSVLFLISFLYRLEWRGYNFNILNIFLPWLDRPQVWPLAYLIWWLARFCSLFHLIKRWIGIPILIFRNADKGQPNYTVLIRQGSYDNKPALLKE